jgi:hypothetical protein
MEHRQQGEQSGYDAFLQVMPGFRYGYYRF